MDINFKILHHRHVWRIINNQCHKQWVKWRGHKEDHMCQLVKRSEMCGAMPPLNLTGMVQNQIQAQCYFYLYRTCKYIYGVSTQTPTSPTLMITLSIMRFLQTRAVWPYTVCNNVIFASFHWVTRLLLLHSCKSTDHILTLRSSDVEQMTWHSGSYDTENITPCWKSDEGNNWLLHSI